MEPNFQPCLQRVLVHEGGYTNEATDPGSCTNHGITIFDARLYWKKNATCADVRSMSVDVAEGIYRKQYWDRMRCSELPAGLDDDVLDYSVNSGYSRAGKVVRRLVGLPDTTWQVTGEVLAAVAKRKPADLINAMCDERMRFLRGLAIWPTYANGWTTRVREVRIYDLQLAAKQQIALPKPNPTVQAAGKGKHAPPVIGKTVIKGGGGAIAVGSSVFYDWMAHHPIETGFAAAALGIAVGAGVYGLERWHQARQDAATPGVAVVPVATPIALTA